MQLTVSSAYCTLDKSPRGKTKNFGRPLVSDGGLKLLATSALNS